MPADARPLQTTAQAVLENLSPSECPVCHVDHERDHLAELDAFDDSGDPPSERSATHNAAHCCLWHSYSHAARTRIAQRVEEGSNWAEAIEGERNV